MTRERFDYRVEFFRFVFPSPSSAASKEKFHFDVSTCRKAARRIDEELSRALWRVPPCRAAMRNWKNCQKFSPPFLLFFLEEHFLCRTKFMFVLFNIQYDDIPRVDGEARAEIKVEIRNSI